MNKKIVLGLCGGIAAYKSAYLVRNLVKLGAEVRVVMTKAAQEFITPLTLQALSGHEVRTDLFDTQAERAMGHIELARWADYLVIAPATANCLAKLANGIADDLLSTLYLVTETPVIICPAMNRSMWQHPTTQQNCQKLSDLGAMIVGPDTGSQACGEEGFGRLIEGQAIIDALRLESIRHLLKGQAVMITAGSTQESLDPVRYLSNHSSGKMGYALAQAAYYAGANVTLISGPSQLDVPLGVTYQAVVSAEEMYRAVLEHLKPGMLFIGCAAVADYRPEKVATQKIKKTNDKPLSLQLIQNHDILAEVAKTGIARYTIGFAAETHELIKNAENKRNKKQADMIIANQVGENQGFNQDENQVVIITRDQQIALPLMNKTRLAGQIIQILATIAPF